MSNLVLPVFWSCFFLTPLLIFVFILSFFFGILIYLLFSIFFHPWCCLSVFLLSTKHKSPSNQNVSSIWIFTKDVQILKTFASSMFHLGMLLWDIGLTIIILLKRLKNLWKCYVGQIFTDSKRKPKLKGKIYSIDWKRNYFKKNVYSFQGEGG